MRNAYLRALLTRSVERAQLARYGKAARVAEPGGEPMALGPSELGFIAERDSFYLASVSESGWPYVQHRGGAKGFLRVLGPRRLAFVDLEGNRQLISAGNIAANDRVSLFLMDYRARERLKIIGHARLASLDDEPELAVLLGRDVPASSLRVFVIEVVGFDWNCPKFIVQRFSRGEVEEAMQPLRERIAELESLLSVRGGADGG